MDRLAMLQQMAAQKPDDPFPRYGLAMEYKKQGRADEAWSTFEALMESHPDYVASYLMAGNLLESMGRSDEAAGIYDRGMDVAKAAGDAHSLSELEAARAGLG